jgi:hypothetical protein
MPATDRDTVALRPFADVLAIAAAKLIPLAVDVVDDVALFRPFCLDGGSRHFSNFGRNEGCATFKGAAGKSYGQTQRAKNQHDANQSSRPSQSVG